MYSRCGIMVSHYPGPTMPSLPALDHSGLASDRPSRAHSGLNSLNIAKFTTDDTRDPHPHHPGTTNTQSPWYVESLNCRLAQAHRSRQR
jgi:hypothetical protein